MVEFAGQAFFVLTVCMCLGLVALLSALAVWGLQSFRGYLLPDPDEVYLTVETVMARRNGLRLAAGEMPEDQVTLVDEAVLSRILENLVGNALRFADDVVTLLDYPGYYKKNRTHCGYGADFQK